MHFVWNLGTPIRRIRYESGLRALSGKIEFPIGEQESRTSKKIILGSRCGNLRTIGHCQPTRWRVNVRWYRGAEGRKRGTRKIRQGGERNGRLCVRIRRVQLTTVSRADFKLNKLEWKIARDLWGVARDLDRRDLWTYFSFYVFFSFPPSSPFYISV